MKKKIKYEKLSKEVKDEIEAFCEDKKKDDADYSIEEAMEQWFEENFEEWIRKKYAEDKNADKRKHFRLDIEVPVRLVDTLIESADKESDDMGIVGTITNISRGGLYFESEQHIEPSSIVMTKIDLSAIDHELNNIEALAMVMRSTKISGSSYGIGLMFSSIYDDQKKNLDLFVFKNIAYHIYSI